MQSNQTSPETCTAKPGNRRTRRAGALQPVAVSLMAIGLLGGCTAPSNSGSGSGSGGSGGGTPTPDPYANITGNWQFQATSTKGPVPFTALSGFVNELNVNATAQTTSASLLPSGGSCFSSSDALPLLGNVQQAQVYLGSFTIDSQVVTLNGTQNEAGNSFSGTYSVAGGCADGATGTLTGTLYQTLSGTYAGTLAADPTKSVSVNVTQYTLGTGNGTFLASGTAAVQGFSCFSSGTMAADGTAYVTGSNVVLTFSTSDGNGAQLVLAGTFNAAATQLTINSIQVKGDSCAGSYGSVTLAKQ